MCYSSSISVISECCYSIFARISMLASTVTHRLCHVSRDVHATRCVACHLLRCCLRFLLSCSFHLFLMRCQYTCSPLCVHISRIKCTTRILTRTLQRTRTSHKRTIQSNRARSCNVYLNPMPLLLLSWDCFSAHTDADNSTHAHQIVCIVHYLIKTFSLHFAFIPSLTVDSVGRTQTFRTHFIAKINFIFQQVLSTPSRHLWWNSSFPFWYFPLVVSR